LGTEGRQRSVISSQFSPAEGMHCTHTPAAAGNLRLPFVLEWGGRGNAIWWPAYRRVSVTVRAGWGPAPLMKSCRVSREYASQFRGKPVGYHCSWLHRRDSVRVTDLLGKPLENLGKLISFVGSNRCCCEIANLVVTREWPTAEMTVPAQPAACNTSGWARRTYSTQPTSKGKIKKLDNDFTCRWGIGIEAWLPAGFSFF
jgi:hypothetical protein